MNLDVIKASGLRQKGDLDVLLGVNRVVVNYIFSGKRKPNKELEARMKRLSKVVEILLEKQLLPPPSTDARNKIVSKIKTVLDSS